jgi:hypothetical protein
VPAPQVAARSFRNWVPSGERSPALFFTLFLEESAVDEHMTTPVPPLRWNQGKRMGVVRDIFRRDGENRAFTKVSKLARERCLWEFVSKTREGRRTAGGKD